LIEAATLHCLQFTPFMLWPFLDYYQRVSINYKDMLQRCNIASTCPFFSVLSPASHAANSPTGRQKHPRQEADLTRLRSHTRNFNTAVLTCVVGKTTASHYERL